MPPRRPKPPKAKASPPSNSSADIKAFLRDIKGENELGVVARMAARRFDLPVYSKDSQNRDRLPAKAGKANALERILQVFETLWATEDTRLQGAICIMLSKLALDDTLRSQLTCKNWLPKVIKLVSSDDSSLVLASLNAVAELVHKGEYHGIAEEDLPNLADKICDVSNQLAGKSETERLVLKSLGRIVGHCEGCSQAVDPDRLRPLLLAALSNGDKDMRSMATSIALSLPSTHLAFARRDPAFRRFIVAGLRSPEPSQRLSVGIHVLQLNTSDNLPRPSPNSAPKALKTDPAYSLRRWQQNSKMEFGNCWGYLFKTGNLLRFGQFFVKALTSYDKTCIGVHCDTEHHPLHGGSSTKTTFSHDNKYQAIQATIDVYRHINKNSYVAAVLHIKLLLAANKFEEVSSAMKEYILVHPKSALLCWWACYAAYQVEDNVEALHWAKKGLDCNPTKGFIRCNLLYHAHLCSFRRASDLVVERAEEGFSPQRQSAPLSYLTCAHHYGMKTLDTLPLDYPDRLDVVIQISQCQLILSGSNLSPTLVELKSLWTRFEEVKRQAWEDVDCCKNVQIYFTTYAALELVKQEYAEAAREWDPVWKRMEKEEEKEEGTLRWNLPVMEPGEIPVEDSAMACRCCGAKDVPLRLDSTVEVFGVGTVLMRHCLYCNARGANLRRCTTCHTSCYCSVECQRKDWPTHKKQCKPFDQLLKKWGDE